MWFYLLKLLITAMLVLAISELAKRNNPLAALVAALPVISLLAMVWMHLEGSPASEIAVLSKQIFWLVLPSLVLFLLLPWLINLGYSFWFSLGLASGVSVLTYSFMLWILKQMGVWT
jgi:hypothetical protein